MTRWLGLYLSLVNLCSLTVTPLWLFMLWIIKGTQIQSARQIMMPDCPGFQTLCCLPPLAWWHGRSHLQQDGPWVEPPDQLGEFRICMFSVCVCVCIVLFSLVQRHAGHGGPGAKNSLWIWNTSSMAWKRYSREDVTAHQGLLSVPEAGA